MWKQFPIVIDNAPFYYYPDVKQIYFVDRNAYIKLNLVGGKVRFLGMEW
jgi:hypothetical protein